MALLPKLKGFVMEDFRDAPEWLSKLVSPLNDFMTAVTNGLTGRLTRKDNFLGYIEAFDFTTEATAANTFPLRFKNKLLGGVKPTSVYVGLIEKRDGAAMASAWSIEAKLAQTGEIEVRFQGLENSTRYIGNLVIDG